MARRHNPLRERKPSPAKPAPLEPLAVRRRDACRALGVGMTKLKELIRDGKLKETRIGTASLIHVSSMRELVGEQATTP